MKTNSLAGLEGNLAMTRGQQADAQGGLAQVAGPATGAEHRATNRTNRTTRRPGRPGRF